MANHLLVVAIVEHFRSANLELASPATRSRLKPARARLS